MFSNYILLFFVLLLNTTFASFHFYYTLYCPPKSFIHLFYMLFERCLSPKGLAVVEVSDWLGA